MITFDTLGIFTIAADVEFVSYTLTRATTDTIVATAPSGIQDGDLLVAVCVRNQTGFSITSSPAGFSQLLDHDTTTNSFVIFSKVASSESGNYSFTWSAGAGQNGLVNMMLFRNCASVETLGTPSYQSANTGAADSISPASTGLLIGVYVRQDANALVSADPSGLTLIQANTGSNPEIVTYYKTNNPAGATGTKTISWNDAAADDCSQFLMQIV